MGTEMPSLSAALRGSRRAAGSLHRRAPLLVRGCHAFRRRNPGGGGQGFRDADDLKRGGHHEDRRG